MYTEFNFSVNAWIAGVQVLGDSLEDCKNELYKMSLEELIEEGYVKDFTMSEVDGTVIDESVTVEVSDIEYDITDDDEDDNNLPAEMIREQLPTKMQVGVDLYEPDLNKNIELDINDEIADAIAEKTGFCVKNFKYKIIDRW